MELIDDVNRSFGDGKLSYEDVKHTYGGLRPLVEKETAKPMPRRANMKSTTTKTPDWTD